MWASKPHCHPSAISQPCGRPRQATAIPSVPPPIPSFPVPSHPIPFRPSRPVSPAVCPVPPRPVPSRPVPSRPVPSLGADVPYSPVTRVRSAVDRGAWYRLTRRCTSCAAASLTVLPAAARTHQSLRRIPVGPVPITLRAGHHWVSPEPAAGEGAADGHAGGGGRAGCLMGRDEMDQGGAELMSMR